MTPFSKFLFINEISRKEISEYLEVSQSFVGQICSGAKKLSEKKLKRIYDHPGWDLTPFEEDNGGIIRQTSGRDSNYVHGNLDYGNTELTTKLYGIIEQQQKQIDRLMDLLEKRLDEVAK